MNKNSHLNICINKFKYKPSIICTNINIRYIKTPLTNFLLNTGANEFQGMFNIVTFNS